MLDVSTVAEGMSALMTFSIDLRMRSSFVHMYVLYVLPSTQWQVDRRRRTLDRQRNCTNEEVNGPAETVHVWQTH